MSLSGSNPEKRAFGRRQTHDHALVRVPGRPPARCVIRNISEGGALLDFGEAVWLPFTFRLTWESSRREEDCEIKHSNGGRVGVHFVTRKSEDARPQTLTVNDVAPWIAEHPHGRR